MALKHKDHETIVATFGQIDELLTKKSMALRKNFFISYEKLETNLRIYAYKLLSKNNKLSDDDRNIYQKYIQSRLNALLPGIQEQMLAKRTQYKKWIKMVAQILLGTIFIAAASFLFSQIPKLVTFFNTLAKSQPELDLIRSLEVIGVVILAIAVPLVLYSTVRNIISAYKNTASNKSSKASSPLLPEEKFNLPNKIMTDTPKQATELQPVKNSQLLSDVNNTAAP